MWCVIQTMVGWEEKMRREIVKTVSPNIINDCFYIKYENIWKKEGISNICEEMLFPGYIFVDTDNSEALYLKLKEVSGFTALITDRNADDRTILEIDEAEQEFLENLINGDPDHVVRVSYVHRNNTKRIDQAKGPLSNYVDKIVSVDFHHRRVFIEVPFLNDTRRIKLAIVAEEDIKKEKKLNNKYNSLNDKNKKTEPEQLIDKWDWKTRKEIENFKNSTNIIIEKKGKKLPEETEEVAGIKAGDWICDNSETYVDKFMKVKRVIPKKNAVIVEVSMFGTVMELEMDVADVHKVVVRE